MSMRPSVNLNTPELVEMFEVVAERVRRFHPKASDSDVFILILVDKYNYYTDPHPKKESESSLARIENMLKVLLDEKGVEYIPPYKDMDFSDCDNPYIEEMSLSDALDVFHTVRDAIGNNSTSQI